MIVRSPVAHGTIRSIETSEALALPGVVGIWTAADIISEFGSVPLIQPRVSFDKAVVPYLQPVLAVDKVRYVGEPVALIIATDRYTAEDADDLVFVDIDPIDACIDTSTASQGEPLFPEGNEITVLTGGFGDLAVFTESPVIIEAELKIGRHSGVPMETRGLVVQHDADSLIVHGSTKVPHANRDQLAKHLGISPNRIRMKETSVGGGFGVRGEFYPEDFLIPWAALKLKGTISWIEDRREHFLAANQAREQTHQATIAGDLEGRILGLRSEFFNDMGAYVRTHGIRIPDLTLSMLPGPYDIGAYEGIAHCVLTNKTPTATYRAPGRFESCFVRERLIDMYAANVGIDPIEVRRKNLIRPDQMPYRRALQSTGELVIFNEGNYAKLLGDVKAKIDIPGIVARRGAGEWVGVGIAMFLEKSGLGPWESGSVVVSNDGTILVRTGCSSVGQGLRTVLGQIAAETFDVDLERVRVELLDTEHSSYGTGSYASRSTATGGSAVLLAARHVIDTARSFAAPHLEVDRDDLVVRDGGLEVAGAPDLRLGFGEIARMLGPTSSHRGTAPPGLRAEEFFHVKKLTYPYGCHAAVVSVDPETGLPTVERLILGYDIGRAINPKLVEGQLHGGALQGLAGAILERFSYDEEGNPLVTSFMDYLMPTIAEAPQMTTLITEDAPTETNPLGVKGTGEGGLTGVAAAIATAIDDALQTSGLVTEVPVDLLTLTKAVRS
ncbi:MAG: molybdopterin-dependent oxidoreductase [Actinobacteria bacterium]|nr:molybdopterin-dependent oxidoreductase [Actinomycetota bacterium]